MKVCYWGAEACRHGHAQNCPILKMTANDVALFFGTTLGSALEDKASAKLALDRTATAGALDYPMPTGWVIKR